MPIYTYRAISQHGDMIKNKVESESKSNLAQKLRENGYTVIEISQVGYGKKVEKKRKNKQDLNEIMKIANSTRLVKGDTAKQMSFSERVRLAFQGKRKVTTRDLVIFTQNFLLLKEASFNNIHALRTIIDSTENPTLRGVLEDILAGVEDGEYMYTTMEYYSNIFPYIYTNMIKVGELSGGLENSLKQAEKYLEESSDITKRVRRMIVPNVLQIVAVIALMVVGTLYGVPMVENIYAEVGSTATLPGPTLWFSKLVHSFMRIWYIPVGIIAVAAIVIVRYVHTPKGRYRYHYFKYTMPIFGRLNFAIDFNRLIKAMSLNIDNGMRIQEALEVGKNVVKNNVMLSIIETSINNIIIGESWIEPFERAGIASSMMTEMLKIGMQTDLSQMMKKLLELIESDINNTMDKIMKIMPQIIYLIVGVFIIFFVVIILVPAIQVYMGNFLFSAAGL